MIANISVPSIASFIRAADAPRRFAWLFVVAALGGCARYVAVPLERPAPGAWTAQRLDDPRVLQALDSLFGGLPPVTEWTEEELARAGWVLAPARERVAATIAAERAGLERAGGRPAVGVGSETEMTFSGRDGSSRWGLAVAGLFRLESGGKRDARRARAEAAWLSAIASGAAEAWRFEGGVRLAVRRAVERTALAHAAAGVVSALDSAVALAEERYVAASLGRVELARLEAERAAARRELSALEREAADERAAVAAALGVPAAALDPLGELRATATRCPDPAARLSLLAAALERRWDLREVIAGYLAAEAEVRAEVAASWPDLDLGPGLFFDHGAGKWTFGFGLPSLPLHGNRRGIAEAEARRTVVAARVREWEARVMSEVDFALAGCAAAEAERGRLDAGGATARLEGLQAAYARGEAGRLEVLLARVEVARLVAARQGLEGNVELAAAEVARVTGAWARAEP